MKNIFPVQHYIIFSFFVLTTHECVSSLQTSGLVSSTSKYRPASATAHTVYINLLSKLSDCCFITNTPNYRICCYTCLVIFMHHVEKNCECLVPVQGGLIHMYCMYICFPLKSLYLFLGFF